jgi:hypothetical protein
MKADGLQLKTGTRLYLQRSRPDGVIEVMPCTLDRTIDNQELVVHPQSSEDFPSFAEGETYTTRIVAGNKRYAFATTILSKAEQQQMIHLSYPQEMETVYTRKAPRFLIAKPIRLSLRSGDKTVAVYIHDISRSGACLIAEHSLAKGDDVLNIELRDPFDQSLITLHCLVRYVLFDMVDGVINYRHGVEFQFADDDEQLQLERFIEYLLHERFASPSSTN